jgi:hypothetical protein
MPRSPVVTLLVYKPSKVKVSLGWLDDAVDSSLNIHVFWLTTQKGALREKLTTLMRADLTTRNQNPWLPANMYVLLVDGLLPEGDVKHDLDSILRGANTEALKT